MADQQDRKLHIVMLPWLSFGHIIPFLNISILIAQKGHKVSFISTPRNIDRLPKPPPNLADCLNFVKLPLPHHKNLPENAEASSDVARYKITYLEQAFDGLQEPITEFLQQNTIDWVFHDYVSYWMPSIASKLKIPTVYFSIFPATILGFFGPVDELKGIAEGSRKKPEDYTVKPKWVTFETSVSFKLVEIMKNADGLANREENVADTFRLGSSLEGCDIIAVRSCYDFEQEWLKLLEDLHRKPVIQVGLLPGIEYDRSRTGEHIDADWRSYKEFLDKKEKGSVVYVAFGGEVKPSQAELVEIALGLELSGLPFFWALRMKRDDEDTENIELPQGFEERTKDRGVVCTSWAPQLKILNHDSVGGFLTHCGFSSVVEAVQFGKAIILLPFFADHVLISRTLEEKMMGYSIPRDDTHGFNRLSVAESLRLVMIEEDGKIYRENVKVMKGLFSDLGGQDLHVENLLAFLKSYRSSKTYGLE